MTARETLEIDAKKESARVESFIRRLVKGASANGVVIGLSGGIDSSVAGALCVRALGKGRVLGLLMPSDHTPAQDVSDASALAAAWGIQTEEVPISKVVSALSSSAGVEGTRIAKANLQARVRMTILYYFANALGYLVAGTGDRSEGQLGYFTKGGDGMADFLPIAHLYKAQVRSLGSYLGIPRAIVEKAPSPQLWTGHTAADELPAGYDKLDLVLHQLFDLKSGPATAARKAGVPLSVVKKVLEMHARSEHKRAMPPSVA